MVQRYIQEKSCSVTSVTLRHKKWNPANLKDFFENKIVGFIIDYLKWYIWVLIKWIIIIQSH